MAKRGNIFYTDKDFTDLEVQQQFGFPVIVILHDNNSVIKKISAFDENGAKSIYDFSLAASKDFVTATIATAISNLKDNTLEFPTFADFPQPGEVGNVYIDLAEDKIYIWDSASSSYISQSWNQTIITGLQTQLTSLQNNKLDKGTYVGTAQDLYNRFEGKIVASINSIPKVGNGASGKVLEDSIMGQYDGKIGIGTPGEPTEKLDVNGNVKATQIKDQYGTVRSQRIITVTGNITLSEIHNGAILHIINTCNITIPTGLGADFACDFYVKGAFIATFVNSGVTLNSPSGLLLKTDKMATLYSNASDMFNLLGELATS